MMVPKANVGVPGVLRKFPRRIFLLIIFFTFISGLYAQTGFPVSYWILDAGGGMSDVLEDGASFGVVIDPKLSLSPALTVGSKNFLNFSTEGIIALETQAYLRWNFLRLGSSGEGFLGTHRTADIFIQGGVGLLGALKGPDDVDEPNRKKTRASMLFDGTAGITIPLSARWHIEPSVRGGYPFIWGFALTAGYTFPLPQRTVHETVYRRLRPKIEYVEIIRTLPPNEIVKRILISQVEYIIFGPDTSQFDEDIDADARALNTMVLAQVTQTLKDNPDFRVRIEGHANPVTQEPKEAEELIALSEERAKEVARLFEERGVESEQIVVIAYGGTRTAASDHDHWNMNRRVELIVIQIDTN